MCGKPSEPARILENLGHAARELGASSVLPLSSQNISNEMEPVALPVLDGLFMRYF